MNQYYGSYNLREGVAFPLQQRWLWTNYGSDNLREGVAFPLNYNLICCWFGVTVGVWYVAGLGWQWEFDMLMVWSDSGSLICCWFGVTMGVWYVAGLEWQWEFDMLLEHNVLLFVIYIQIYNAYSEQSFSEWVSDCCLTPNQQFFNYISLREQVNFEWDDDEVRFLLDQHA